ncbi:uncharacterized protein LOC131655031 isoform X1 [Vicia villosa]|uniref:uncharacterized protein LOC131655031 isoform X1 n=2 Tax=Vicia villosa TaxID=3911 RepID=UPI00273CDE8C|nr:uncharacterized protein LOC131655031 isoform X1 [Vicia villosa]
MEGEIRVWCLEHLLRKSSIKTNLINKFISKISLSNTDYRTKKTMILRTLEDALSEAFIPEYMLQIFEVLEKLLLCRDSSNPNSNSNSIAAAMKAAYCSIAVEFTLKHLDAGTSNPMYGKAVKRIWKDRVHDMHNEGSSFLLSDELKEWKSEIEKSLLDGEVRKKLASIPFTRRDAIVKVQAFLAEAWEDLGPSFLESVANNQLDSSVDGLQKQQEVSPIEIRKDNEKVEGKFTTAVDLEEVDLSTSCVKADTLRISESTKNGESLKGSSVELQTLAKDSGLVIEDTNEEPQMENPSLDANLPNAQACQGSNNNETNLNETTSVHQSDAHLPNLMKPNSTARTHEWDDSIDGLHASKFSLPSPKRRKHSPLKAYEPKNIVKRRKPKKWSKLEEDTLRTGVNTYDFF